MSSNKNLTAAAVIALVGASIGIAGSSSQAHDTGVPSPSDGIRCEIKSQHHANTVTLTGVVFAPDARGGSYTLKVAKVGDGGNTAIKQSGEFTTQSDAQTQLGVVTLGGDGSYLAKLTVVTNGQTYECQKRVGGSL